MWCDKAVDSKNSQQQSCGTSAAQFKLPKLLEDNAETKGEKAIGEEILQLRRQMIRRATHWPLSVPIFDHRSQAWNVLFHSNKHLIKQCFRSNKSHSKWGTRYFNEEEGKWRHTKLVLRDSAVSQICVSSNNNIIVAGMQNFKYALWNRHNSLGSWASMGLEHYLDDMPTTNNKYLQLHMMGNGTDLNFMTTHAAGTIPRFVDMHYDDYKPVANEMTLWCQLPPTGPSGHMLAVSKRQRMAVYFWRGSGNSGSIWLGLNDRKAKLMDTLLSVHYFRGCIYESPTVTYVTLTHKMKTTSHFEWSVHALVPNPWHQKYSEAYQFPKLANGTSPYQIQMDVSGRGCPPGEMNLAIGQINRVGVSPQLEVSMMVQRIGLGGIVTPNPNPTFDPADDCGTNGCVTKVVFGASGQHVALMFRKGKLMGSQLVIVVCVWNAQTGLKITEFNLHRDAATALAFSDGERQVVVYVDDQLQFYDVSRSPSPDGLPLDSLCSLPDEIFVTKLGS